MAEVSELIYETCKAYLVQQGKFLLILLGLHRRGDRRVLRHAGHTWTPRAPSTDSADRCIILLFSLIGMAGSYGVAWFGIRINTFANSRTAFASLRGKACPVYADPAQGRA